MLLTFKRWGLIRDKFSEEEKVALNNALTGSTVCPPGMVVDETMLTPELLAKVKEAVQ
jgi:hypothetical protein